MASKRGTMPDVLFVSPIGHNKIKHRHKHVLFRIEERGPDGVPTKLTMLKDDETEVISEDDPTQFMTGYVLQVMTEPCQKHADYKRGK